MDYCNWENRFSQEMNLYAREEKKLNESLSKRHNSQKISPTLRQFFSGKSIDF